MRSPAAILPLVLLAVLAGCSSPAPDRHTDARSTTSGAVSTTSSSTASSVPAASTTVPDPATRSGTVATPTCPAIPPRATPDANRTRYRIDARLDLVANELTGALAATFTPDVATDRLVLRVWANGPRLAAEGASEELPSITVDGRHDPVDRPDATTWVIRPPGGIAAGQSVLLEVSFTLRLPGPANDRISRTGDAVRLGSFFPVLAWEPGRGWATEPATPGFAEASTVPTADFDVALEVPAGLSVLGSGELGPDGRWKAIAMRDFAASIGRFRTATATVDAGRPVNVTVGVADGMADDPAAYLDKVTRVLRDFGRRFGAYPWSSYSLALTPNLTGGIEYPAHVMQGPGYIGRTTSHEVGHMWFYGLVGNNQGRDPVLDEGLATYAEARFEDTLASLKATPIPAAGRGRAGEPMVFWDRHRSEYYRSVYVQGAVAIAALGPPEAVDCALRLLIAATAYQVVDQATVVRSLQVVFPDAPAVLGSFGIR